MQLVQFVEQIKLRSLSILRQVFVFNMLDDLFGIEVGDVAALVSAGEKAITPKLWADHWLARAENDKARQVLILGPEAIA